VVEGNFDLLLLAIHGIDNVVAPLGTALTREHVKTLRRYCDEVVLLFDGDSAGLRAARRSIPFFLSEQLEVRVALLPTGHDPDTLVREKGVTAVQTLVDEADPLAEFVFSALKEEHGLTLSGKNRIIAELTELVAQAAHADQQELMAAHFAEQLGVSPERFILEKKGAGQVEQVPVPPWPPEGRFEGGEQEEWGPPPPDFPSDGGEEWDEHSFVVPESELSGSLYGIAKTQQQLLDLLLLYPEFLPRLLAGGLKDALGVSPVVGLVEIMEQLATDGAFTAEQLLAVVPTGDYRQYIAEVLTRDGGAPFAGEDGEDEEQGDMLCDELLVWLQEMQRQRKMDELRKQINVAEQKGDSERVSELQRQFLRCKEKKSENEN
jgi:DNA primase